MRTIKPGFFTNDVLAECEPLARILFAGLWTVADRAGRLEERPKKLKAELLPYDDCDIAALIDQLSGHGFIKRYEANGTQYIQILAFDKHQCPNIKEPASTIPPPADEVKTGTAGMVQAPSEHSESTVQASGGHSTISNSNRTETEQYAPPPDVYEDPVIGALLVLCKLELDTCGEAERLKLHETAEWLRRKIPNEIPPLIARFGVYFQSRNLPDPTPSVGQVRKDWGRFEVWNQKNAPPPKLPVTRAPEGFKRAGDVISGFVVHREVEA
jgi:hypothetical protein